MKIQRLLTGVCLIAILFPVTGLCRTWTDRSGKHRVEAQLSDVTKTHAVLLRSDGRTARIPLAKLSPSDARFAKAWARKNAAAAKRTKPRKTKESPIGQLTCSINGKPFTPDTISLSDDILTFQAGEQFRPTSQVMLFLFAKDGVDGKTFETARGRFGANPHVHLRWQDGDKYNTEIEMSDYDLKLSFDHEIDGKVSGMISLDIPKYKCRMRGPFTVEIPRDYTLPPTDDDRPYVKGNVSVVGNSQSMLVTGYHGYTTEGKVVSNSVGTEWFSSLGDTDVTSHRNETSTTLMTRNKKHMFQHLQLTNGPTYVFAKIGNYMTGKWVEVDTSTAHTANVTLDLKKVGSLNVTVGPKAKRIYLVPLGNELDDVPSSIVEKWKKRGQSIMKKTTPGETVTIENLRPGWYHVRAGRLSDDVQVHANAEVDLRLSVK